MNSDRIALLSLACRYPEARDSHALWRNVLEGRRSFRAIPDSRLPLGDYDKARVGIADSIPRVPAALLTDWTFSREVHRVAKATFEATDLTHWLALDVASEAISAVGGPEALPRDRTAVIIGDTLTGEFTRSSQLRLRRPYLARKLTAVLDQQGIAHDEQVDLVEAFVGALAADFPDPNEDSLAGALANTIAGRLANMFDFNGGAWTIDGACASSLLAVADGCSLLEAGDVDVAVVGGVDLSLDPFELVGFARTGALAHDEMRVFDRRASGFWPGEGCGIAILATETAASRIGGTPLGWVRGWGVSTDGAGGLTRPTVAGQSLALERAWRRAGQEPAEAGLFEAHGTGTAVGDPTEIRGIAALLTESKLPVPVGSIKGNIGHCKAAAGMAGLIKATCALKDGIVPPHVGCEEPSPVFAETGNRLTPAKAGEWRGAALAGVSGFGFGGVNAHVVLEGHAPRRAARPRAILEQDAELFVFAASNSTELRESLQTLRDRASTLSYGEMVDAAAATIRAANPKLRCRAAVVAGKPEELRDELKKAIEVLPTVTGEVSPRIGYIFPGQSAPSRPSGGAWAKRFPADCDLLAALPLKASDGALETEFAQPAIVAASLIGIRLMDRFGVHAHAAAGHSLGELTAYSWGGVLDERACLDLAKARGSTMAAHAVPGGGMVRVSCNAVEAELLAERFGLAVGCLNGPNDMVLSGGRAAIEQLVASGKGETLRVSHAFHSSDMDPTVDAYRSVLDRTSFSALERPVVSSVTGTWVCGSENLRAIMLDQLTKPVRFADAVDALQEDVDLLIEVGPGTGLKRLATNIGVRCLALDTCAPTLRPMLSVLAELWRCGTPLDLEPLFSDRPVRTFCEAPPKLLSNPCGLPTGSEKCLVPFGVERLVEDISSKQDFVVTSEDDELGVVLEAVATELGLPIDSVGVNAKLLDDLHLNSLSVGRIVGAAAARLNMANPASVMDLSNMTSAEVAAYLAELRKFGGTDSTSDDRVEGVAPWVAEFETVWEASKMPAPAETPVKWRWFGSVLPEAALQLSIAKDGTGALVYIDVKDNRANSSEAALEIWRQVKAAHALDCNDLAIVHHGAGIEGFIHSVVADGMFSTGTYIDISKRPDGWSDVQKLLSSAPRGVSSWRLAPRDGLQRPAFARVPKPDEGTSALGPKDVALVVGGAQGIGAECALRLAATHGVSLAIIGRSPVDTPAVLDTVERAKALGVRAIYQQADVSSSQSLGAAVTAFTKAGLSPTLAVHAAGVNEPSSFDNTSEKQLCKTLSPKLDGLEALIETLDLVQLKVVVGFGSIIGTFGLAGESHYAMANGMMAERLIRWGEESHVRTLALDWSVWAGAGMGERLGAIERLQKNGVDPLPLESALARFDQLVSHPDERGRRVVTSRFGPPGHVRFAASSVPPLRYIEKLRIHFPDIELIADAVISRGSDPWLDDHIVDGNPIVPGVMLLEAAAQAAFALTGRPITGFQDVYFQQAVTLANWCETLRIAALHDANGMVHITIRAADDGFATDRARVTALLDPVPEKNGCDRVKGEINKSADELYCSLYFNKGRFRRISSLQTASAFTSRVRFSEDTGEAWFGQFLPQTLALGDPASRDAGLHALQACAPQRRVLPVSTSKIILIDSSAPRVSSEAREVWADSDRFCFDIVWYDEHDRPVEVWKEALFHSVSTRSLESIPFWMIPASIERAASMCCGLCDLRVVLEVGGSRIERRDKVLRRLGIDKLSKRGDGAPERSNGGFISLSYGQDSVVAATASVPIGIDIVDSGMGCVAALRSGDQAVIDIIAAQADFSKPAAAAILWAAREALRKVGAPLVGVLNVETARKAGGIILRSEGYWIICLRNGSNGGIALALPIDRESVGDLRIRSSKPSYFTKIPV